MALVSSAFNSYKIWYYAAPQYNWWTIVNVYLDDIAVGRLTFMKEGEEVPANFVSNDDPFLFFPADQYDSLMDILRQEEPLFIGLMDTNGIGFVGTLENEPVGEEEGSGDG